MREAAPLGVGENVLHLSSFAVELALKSMVFVWNMPVSVRVERGGQSQRLLILDWTRIFLIGLGALTAMAAAAPARRALKGGSR